MYRRSNIRPAKRPPGIENFVFLSLTCAVIVVIVYSQSYDDAHMLLHSIRYKLNQKDHQSPTNDPLTTYIDRNSQQNLTSQELQCIDDFLPQTDQIWLKPLTLISNSNISHTKNHNKTDHDDKSYSKSNSNYNCLNPKHARMVWGAHHKTGSVVFQKIKKDLINYCTNYYKTKHIRNHGVSNDILPCWMVFTQGKFNSFAHITRYAKQATSQNIYFLHIMRDPVSLIISGFNYHSLVSIPGLDRWTGNERIKYDSMHTKCLFVDKKIVEDIKQHANDVGLDRDIVSQYGDWSLNHLLRSVTNISLHFAIYIEYKRWECNDYQNTLFAFNLANNIENYAKYGIKQAFNLKFEYLFGFYNLQTIKQSSNTTGGMIITKHCRDVIFDQLSLASNFDNSLIKLLQTIPDLSVNHYRKLVKRLSQYDMNKWDDEKINNNKHVTSFGNKNSDKERQLQALLQPHNSVCQNIKEKTLSLDYLWLYSEFC